MQTITSIIFSGIFLIGFTYNGFSQDTTSITIGELEIMTIDLGKLSFEQAQKACEDLGDGWRLPTKDEFNVLCEHKDKISGLAPNSWYWTNSELNAQAAWIRYSENCDEMLNQKRVAFSVRAVRSAK